MPWRPEVAILANETTLLPFYIALAPSATLVERIPTQVAAVLTRYGLPPARVEEETAAMGDASWAKTSNRSIDEDLIGGFLAVDRFVVDEKLLQCDQSSIVFGLSAHV